MKRKTKSKVTKPKTRLALSKAEVNPKPNTKNLKPNTQHPTCTERSRSEPKTPTPNTQKSSWNYIGTDSGFKVYELPKPKANGIVTKFVRGSLTAYYSAGGFVKGFNDGKPVNEQYFKNKGL